jgi:hypothetical protein
MWRSHSTLRLTIQPPVCDLAPATKPHVEMSRKCVLQLSSRQGFRENRLSEILTLRNGLYGFIPCHNTPPIQVKYDTGHFT